MREKISVALASYNGEKYIKEQVESILANLQEGDELVISDDGSRDRTLEIIGSLSDPRIKVVKGPGRGIKKNFENAIANCGGKYIFLSDQDDIWEKEKVDTCLKHFTEGVNVVVHDCRVVDDEGNTVIPSFKEFRGLCPGVIKNIWKNTYIGCCMAFRADLKYTVIPVPNNIEMHDQWIGILGEIKGKSIFIDDKLIRYRRHGDNASEIAHHHPVMVMIRNRWNLVWNVLKRLSFKVAS